MALNPLVTAGSILEVVNRCDSADVQAGENVLHYVVSASTGVGVGLSDIGVHLFDAFKVLYAPMLANTCVFSSVTVTEIFPLPRSLAVRVAPGPVAGTGGAVPLPEQAAGLFTKLTLFGGRSGRGRAYIPFPSVTANGPAGVPTAAYQLLLNALMGAMTNTINVAIGGNSVALSPCLVKRSVPISLLATTPVVDGELRVGWATQRRRSYYGRRNP